MIAPPEGAPRARALIGLVGLARWGAPGRVVATWEPVYGRPAEAQARWEMPMDAPYRIRSAVPADAAALVAIERRCFSDPWSEASFREALASRWTFGLVAARQRGDLPAT